MITTDADYCAATREVQELINWWNSLMKGTADPDPLTIANIHKRLQKLHGEMAEFQRQLVLEPERAIEDQR